ncbi:ABC transporter B family member 29, chloroplastic isoform X2 [Dioscorea cayenensis subsp. rotundata]|uniref:ABC transporter B family member 29, chloroplastic isoform X2 n=1 Tax=Dioscorea cayennensis subsp. rotundata TaxID=55577 RepID=A0AB40B9X1_DIOCR|nr:ABC transporter B family member 29, chloroplastic isoform X2 [Dioscorea cayenensis subsp. rotundata]
MAITMLLHRAPLLLSIPSSHNLISSTSSSSSFQTLTLTLTLPSRSSRSFSLSASTIPSSCSPSPLFDISPFLRSEYRPILSGWLCSAISVCCLSTAVPCLGRVPSALAAASPDRIVRDGLRLAFLLSLRSVACYLQQAFLWEAALGAAYRIRVHVFDRVLEQDMGFFEGNGGIPSGDVANRITTEASDIAETVHALLNSTVPNTLQLIAMASQMINISPVLSLASGMAFPCMLLIMTYLGDWLRRVSNKAQLTGAMLAAYLNEVLPSMLFVKANNGRLIEGFRFQRLAHDDLMGRLGKKKMKALIPQIIQGVGKAYNELKQGEPAIERLFDLTRFSTKVIEKPNVVDLDRVSGDIKFSGVTFKYAENMPLVLNELDLHIKAGETVAFIGPSGGGKTSLAKLLLRLYDPTYGTILVDNHDIQDIRLQSLRDQIVLISQDTMLFSGTVAENIAYRHLTGTIDMDQVEKAARVANADEFIRTLPRGYETNIGQRGSLLSGGQKQRLAIARALYQKPSVLILDEATSALDSRSELLVRQALEHLMANHTVLVIAHRLETILMADRVFLLSGGKLKVVPKSSLLPKDGKQASPELSKLII